jgi:hypothetical protein
MTMSTHTKDHEIYNGTSTKRFNLLRDGDGKAYYNVTEAVPEHLNGTLFRQSDWSAGFNQYRRDNPNAYLDGKNIDTSNGQIILGPDDTAYTPYSYVTYAYADDGGVFTDDSTAAINYTTNDMTLLPATPAENDAYYFGSTTKFSIMCLNQSTAGAGTWTITWEIYNGSSWTTTGVTPGSNTQFKTASDVLEIAIASGATWAQVEVNSTTCYWLRARVSAYTAITTQPKGRCAWTVPMTPMTEATIIARHFCNYGTYYATYYVHCGYIKDAVTTYRVFYCNGTTIKEIWRAPSIIYDMVYFDGYLYCAMGESVKYYYFAPTGFTQSTLTDGYANNFLVAPDPTGSTTVLWKSKNPNEISQSPNPINGGTEWTSPVYVGDDTDNIDIIALSPNNKLLIGKDQGALYQYETDGTIVMLLDKSGTNCGFTGGDTQHPKPVHHKGNLYFIRENSLVEMTSYNSIANVGPFDKSTECVTSTSNLPYYVALAADDRYLYVLCNLGDSNTYTIYKGFYTSGGFSWCPYILIMYTCYQIYISSSTVYGSYLWWSGWFSLNKAYISSNPLDDSNARFNTDGGLVRMSYDYGTNPYWDKMIQSVITETSGCSATVTVTPKYWKNTDSSATGLTAAITTNGVVKTNLTSPLSGNRYQFELDLATGANTSTPIVRLFEVIGEEKPTLYRLHECIYDIGTDIANRTSTLRSFFRTARTSTTLCKFADLRFGETTSGTAGTNYVYVVCESANEVEMYNEKSRQTEMGIKVVWREVNYT